MGTGTIKKVLVTRNSDYLKVLFQIDVMYPLDKRARQTVPHRRGRYADVLDFRIRYDSQNIHNQIRTIESHMREYGHNQLSASKKI